MLTLVKKLFCFKESVSDAPEEGLSIGYRFKRKRFILGFRLREVALHLSRELAGELRPAKHLIGCPRGSAKAGCTKGIKPRSQLNYSQVLLLSSSKEVVSDASEGGETIVQVIPEESNKY